MAILTTQSAAFKVDNSGTSTPAPMIPLVAVPNDDTLRIWNTAVINPSKGAPAEPSSYTITAPDGPLTIVSIVVGANSVLLNLSRVVPDKLCTVTIAAGAFVSTDDAANAEKMLTFMGAATPGPGPDPEPVEPPVVAGWSPPIGSTIERGQEIAFEVTSASGIATVIAWVRFDALRAAELAFDGRVFRGLYVGTVEEIPDGRRFTLRRSAGWPSPPVVVVHATNCNGEETTHVH